METQEITATAETENQNQNPDPEQAPAEEKQPESLADIPLEQLAHKTVPVLRSLATAEGLSTKGIKKDLIKRLRAKKLGGDHQVVKHNSLCKYCKAPAHITGTRVTAVLEDGRRVVQYRLKCSGRRCHRFTRKQIEGQASQ